MSDDAHGSLVAIHGSSLTGRLPSGREAFGERRPRTLVGSPYRRPSMAFGSRAVTPTRWRELYELAAERLGSKSDARRIVERASGREGSDFYASLDDPVPDRALPFFEGMVRRRAAGEPLQYVVGRWGFRSLDLLVDRRVLIPRPETEQVVEVALAELRRTGARKPVVVDLGTGSGAIALSVASEVGGAQVWATDASADALAVARANLAGAGTFVATRVRLAEGSWFAALPHDLRGQVTMIVSNPPYIAASEVLPSEVADWEPTAALVSGATGLEAVEVVVAEAPAWLTTPGVLIVEIAPHQADAAVALAHDAGFAEVEVRPDLAGRARALLARTSSPVPQA